MPKLTLLKSRPLDADQFEFTFACVKGNVRLDVTLPAKTEELARAEALLIMLEHLRKNDEEATRIQRLE